MHQESSKNFSDDCTVVGLTNMTAAGYCFNISGEEDRCRYSFSFERVSFGCDFINVIRNKNSCYLY